MHIEGRTPYTGDAYTNKQEEHGLTYLCVYIKLLKEMDPIGHFE